MSSSAIPDQNTPNYLSDFLGAPNQLHTPINPFSEWKRTINLDRNNTIKSKLPDEIAKLIFSKMEIEQVHVIMESIKTHMDRYSLYRNLLKLKSSLNGTELVKYQRLLSVGGQTLIAEQPLNLIPWATIFAASPFFLSELRYFDLSNSAGILDADVVALTKDCKKLRTLILPGAFPSEEVMAVLKTNCPQAVIYPSAMTEEEWAHPAEFMAKLPPPPQEVTEFINSPRPTWEGQTANQTHIVMPRVNKIVRNFEGSPVIVPWTLKNLNELDKRIGGMGCKHIFHDFQHPAIDTRFDCANRFENGFEWILFTRDVLPQSRYELYESYPDQKELVEHWNYEVPSVLDAATAIFWEKQFSNSFIIEGPFTYTRCHEMYLNWHVVVGNSCPEGIRIDMDYVGPLNIGMAGVKRFKITKPD